ncbi:unnamed protein product [Phytomonas sp. EM1]|nr:unnamed protein product [Phytomonas sp. EM1]|eukprot:CCW62874.1 unnamed protein product [Phytomonas sp. isolate EM1]
MPLIFVHHHKNEVTAFNTECTIGSLNTALVDLANNGDNTNLGKINLSSHFSALAPRAKASDRCSQVLPVEDSAKEKVGSLTASPHLYKKVELVPLSFVLEIASNPKLIAALYKRSSSNSAGMMHGGGPPLTGASASPTDGNASSAPVSSSLTSLLASYVTNIPFVGLRTAPEQSAYFSLPGPSASASNNTNVNDTSSSTYTALVLLGCRMDSSKESGYLNHLSGSTLLPPLDDRRSTVQPDFEERKPGIKPSIYDNHGSSRSGQQPNQQLQLLLASGHVPDANSFSTPLELAVGASRYDNALEMNSGISEKMLDYMSFTGMLNFVKNTHLTPHRGPKGARDDSSVLITHPIPSASSEKDDNTMETDATEGLKSQGTSANEDNTTSHSRSLSCEEAATSAKKLRNASVSQSNAKEVHKKKTDLAVSAAAASIGVSINGTPPIPLSWAAQDLLLSPQRPASSMSPALQTNSVKSTQPAYAAGGNSSERPSALALWLKGVESLDVLWTGPNGEHEVLSRLLQDFVRIEKQKIAADEAARAAALPTRGASVLASSGAADPPKSRK